MIGRDGEECRCSFIENRCFFLLRILNAVILSELWWE
jgi:hypothetical protein